jgi:ferric-dicitrate binding protein FerR (iron transport regulator)
MYLPEDIAVLIEKYLNGAISAEERLQLDQWYSSLADDEAALPVSSEDEKDINERLQRRIFNTIALYRNHTRRFFSRGWQLPVIAASVILILVSIASYYYIYTGKLQGAPLAQKGPSPAETGIVPGGNRALLTLADGSTIALDSASNGMLSRQGNVKVLKLDNGLLSYSGQGMKKSGNNETVFNTISTPRGGQYQVTLSDGTKVWLNAASSISFPVAFAAAERSVSVTGEAYFEVAHDRRRPFKVQINNSEIEVLGTHFNVNAYEDETTVKTTLLEGKIKQTTKDGAFQKTLLPGQQSDIYKNGEMSVSTNVDTGEAVAWMQGNFQFKSADLHAVLRQVSRWYDVDIEYKGNVDLHFTGQLPRSENASTLFENLALTGEVHFRIEGRKIIVSP